MQLAEDRLTPAAKAGIHDLLAEGVNISDADGAIGLTAWPCTVT